MFCLTVLAPVKDAVGTEVEGAALSAILIGTLVLSNPLLDTVIVEGTRGHI